MQNGCYRYYAGILNGPRLFLFHSFLVLAMNSNSLQGICGYTRALKTDFLLLFFLWILSRAPTSERKPTKINMKLTLKFELDTARLFLLYRSIWLHRMSCVKKYINISFRVLFLRLFVRSIVLLLGGMRVKINSILYFYSWYLVLFIGVCLCTQHIALQYGFDRRKRKTKTKSMP